MLHAIYSWFEGLAKVFANQWKLIFSDMGAVIFLVGLPLLYPVAYTLIYEPEVVREMPVAVVDLSSTPQSRELIRTMDASPTMSIDYKCANLSEAKDLFGQNKVFAIVEVPEDYAKKLGRGEQATVPVYYQMSLLLRYRAFVAAMADIQMKMTGDITATRLESAGAEALGISGGMPFEANNNFIGDPSQGFASFVMPGVLILILQQSMVLGICLLIGSSNERRSRNGGIDPKLVPGVAPSARVIGRALAMVVFYIPALIYCARWLPWIFSFPHVGDPVDYMLFLVPFLLASAMFGQSVAGLCTERESTFMVVVFTSIAFLFLSGLTWPRYIMQPFWQMLGALIPSTWGVEGFIRINGNGASLAESARPFYWLWALTACYFITAYLLERYKTVKSHIPALKR